MKGKMKLKWQYILIFSLIFIINYFLSWIWTIWLILIIEPIDAFIIEYFPLFVSEFYPYIIRLFISILLTLIPYHIYFKSKNKKKFWIIYIICFIIFLILSGIAVLPLGAI